MHSETANLHIRIQFPEKSASEDVIYDVNRATLLRKHDSEILMTATANYEQKVDLEMRAKSLFNQMISWASRCCIDASQATSIQYDSTVFYGPYVGPLCMAIVQFDHLFATIRRTLNVEDMRLISTAKSDTEIPVSNTAKRDLIAVRALQSGRPHSLTDGVLDNPQDRQRESVRSIRVRPQSVMRFLARETVAVGTLYAASGRIAIQSGPQLNPSGISRTLRRRHSVSPIILPRVHTLKPTGASTEYRRQIRLPDPEDALLRACAEAFLDVCHPLLLEGSHSALLTAQRLAPRRPPRAVVTSDPCLDSVPMLSVLKAMGTRIIMEQHGGQYFETFFHHRSHYERAISSPMLSWGSVAPGIRPLPSRRLLSMRARTPGRVERNDDGPIVWIGQCPVMGIDYLAPDNSPSYVARQCVIYAAIPPSLKRILVYRPRTKAGQECPDDIRSQAAVSIAALDVPVHNALESARLVILDMAFTTTFLECLTINAPVIVFDPTVLSRLKRAHLHLYLRLERAGIVCMDHRKLVITLREIETIGVRNWWNDAFRQSTVAETIRRLAYVGDSQPESEWSRFINSLEHP